MQVTIRGVSTVGSIDASRRQDTIDQALTDDDRILEYFAHLRHRKWRRPCVSKFGVRCNQLLNSRAGHLPNGVETVSRGVLTSRRRLHYACGRSEAAVTVSKHIYISAILLWTVRFILMAKSSYYTTDSYHRCSRPSYYTNHELRLCVLQEPAF